MNGIAGHGELRGGESAARTAVRPQAGSCGKTPQQQLAAAQAELNAMRLSRNRYRDFHEYAPCACLVLSPAGAIVEANRAGAALLGLPREELPNADVARFVAPEDREGLARFLAGMKDRETHPGCEMTLLRGDGSRFAAQLDGMRLVGDGLPVFLLVLCDISERKAAEEQIRHLALYDDLTQLPNRRLLIDRLQRALTSCARSRRRGALMLIDLDRFKELNDNHGHDHGDLLLQQVAHRLSACIREVDTAARLGGDEFIVMLGDLDEDYAEARRQASAVGQKVLAALNGTYDLFGKQHHSTPSIGITMFGHQRRSVDALLKEADRAMYRAKAKGRNTLHFFASRAAA